MFVDPPYSPGEINTVHHHYMFGTFSYEDQIRLARSLDLATKRGVAWVMTNSNHKDIKYLYNGYDIKSIKNNHESYIGQALIKNY